MAQLIIESSYKVRNKKQKNIKAYKKDLNIKIPTKSITRNRRSFKCCIALKKLRPTNLASTSRIPGITPAALTSVLLHTKRQGQKCQSLEKNYNVDKEKKTSENTFSS